MSTKTGNEGEPTAELYFVEKSVTQGRRINILHQVWLRADGSKFLREVGKLSTTEAERRFGLRRNDFSVYSGGALKA